jgi:chaperonin GroES
MIRTVADRVVCIRHEPLDKTEGGIIIPDSFQKKDKRATIVSVGPLCKEVQVGDTIVLLRPGTEIEHEGKEYTIVRERGDDFVLLFVDTKK